MTLVSDWLARVRVTFTVDGNTAVLRVLKILGVAALFAGSAVLAQSPTSSPSWSVFRSPQLPLTEFYSTPDPLPDGKPGELIRSEPFYDYTCALKYPPFGSSITHAPRTEKNVAVSGVVIVPEGTPPEGGWPIIAWAHDFTGLARQCAPSLLK